MPPFQDDCREVAEIEHAPEREVLELDLADVRLARALSLRLGVSAPRVIRMALIALAADGLTMP